MTMSLDDIVRRLRLRTGRVNATAIMVLCPYHQEKTPSLRLWRGTARFYCHGCQKIGSVLDLAAYVLNVDDIADLDALELALPQEIPPEQLALPF